MLVIGLSYEERQAWPVMRKLIKRKPECAAALLEGLPKEAAVRILLTAKKELDDLLAVSRAFSEVAAKLAQTEKAHAQEETEQAQARANQEAQPCGGGTTAQPQAQCRGTQNG